MVNFKAAVQKMKKDQGQKLVRETVVYNVHKHLEYFRDIVYTSNVSKPSAHESILY